MELVVFGLTVSSSWGNGHATLWRGLARALAARGSSLTFFERDVPWYAAHRDQPAPDGCRLVLYGDFEEAARIARPLLDGCDAAIVTSYCADGVAASRLVLGSRARRRVFYDLDAPVTLARLRRGEPVEYLPPEGLSGFDRVLSFTGGRALDELSRRLGARRPAPLYGSVDPAVHRASPPDERFAADLAYLGTWSADRDARLEALLLAPARAREGARFLVAGALYPKERAWPPNVQRLEHVAPGDHSAFYSSSRLQLNLTRGDMAEMGFCPSGRLFEAAACGAALVSDEWQGLDRFFQPGEEILVARTTDDVLAALDRGPAWLARIGRAARARALAEHTAARRADELIALLEDA